MSAGPVVAWTRAATRRFGSFVAVDTVDLDVHGGEIVGLLGANGAGKTTLIRMLLGLLRPSSGAVALFGQPPSRHTRRRLGYLPQTLGLYDDLTPEENLDFARAAFGTPAAVNGERSGDLWDHRRPSAVVANRPVGAMPLGLQRQVAFAAALDHQPDLLVLDEPTSGVAPLARARLWETIHAAADRGIGVLVTTHYMDEATECDRLVVLAAGRVVATGTVPEIVRDATVIKVDSERWAEAFAAIDGAGLRAALVGRSLRIPGATRIEVERLLGDLQAKVGEAPATLEERFFELTVSAR